MWRIWVCVFSKLIISEILVVAPWLNYEKFCSGRERYSHLSKLTGCDSCETAERTNSRKMFHIWRVRALWTHMRFFEYVLNIKFVSVCLLLTESTCRNMLQSGKGFGLNKKSVKLCRVAKVGQNWNKKIYCLLRSIWGFDQLINHVWIFAAYCWTI